MITAKTELCISDETTKIETMLSGDKMAFINTFSVAGLHPLKAKFERFRRK